MISVNIQVRGQQQIISKLESKIASAPGLVSRINNLIGINAFKLILDSMPKFSGDAARMISMRQFSSKNTATYQIIFQNIRDRRGDKHQYAYYMEYGRNAINYKFDPMMRYWLSPPQATWNKNQIRRHSVGGARPTFFIRNSMMSANGMAKAIMAQEVTAWVK